MKTVIKIIRRIFFFIVIVIVLLIIVWYLAGSILMYLLIKDSNAPPNAEEVQKKYAVILPIKSSGRDVIFFTEGAWAGDYSPMIGICSSMKQCEFGEFDMNMFDKNSPIQVSHVNQHIVQLAQGERKQMMNLATLTTIPKNAIIEAKLQSVGCLFRPKDALRWTFNQENCEK